MLRISCPSCGNQVVFVNAASIYAKCDACDNVVVRRDVNVELLGRMAALQEDQTPLQRGTTGRYQNRAFEIVGRIQIRYKSGFWNEWYVNYNDGSGGWLGEAMGTYFVNQAEPAGFSQPPPAVGDVVTVGTDPFLVVSRMEGQIVAFEGELPFQATPGEASLTFDLRGASIQGVTLDYSDPTPVVYRGEYLGFVELHFQNLRDMDRVDPKRVAIPAKLDCPNCGAKLELKSPGVSQTLVCQYCGSAIDTTDARFNIVWKANQAQAALAGAIALGQKGTLRAVDWEVIGHLRRQVSIEGNDYPWDEYLLYNHTRGYRWLVQSDGHWSFVEPLPGVPSMPGGGLVPMPLTLDIRWDHRTFKHFQTAEATVIGVIGEFYWQVKMGDRVPTSDYVAAPYTLSCETAMEGGRATEFNWSIAEYVSPDEIQRVFGAEPLREGPSVAPNQPNPLAGHGLWKHFTIFTFVGLLIMIAFNLLCQQKPVWTGNYVYYADDAEHSHIGEPFELTGRTSNVVVGVRTDVVNRWAWLHLALINEDTQEAIDFGADVSYYWGSDEDGVWKEGDPNAEIVVPQVPPGRYSLLIDPETGTGDTPEPNIPPTPGVAPTQRRFAAGIAVTRDVPAWSYFVYMELILIIFPIIQSMRYASLEKRRWMESDSAT